MIFDKPIWSPNVMVFNFEEDFSDVLSQSVILINKLAKSIPIIAVYIDRNYSDIIESQIILSNPDYAIYKEVNRHNNTTTSKLLDAGAKYTYYVVPSAVDYKAAYVNLIDILGSDYPIVCIAKNIDAYVDSAALISNGNVYCRQLDHELSFNSFLKQKFSFNNRAFVIE